MTQERDLTPEQVDAHIAAHALRERSQLWRNAKGQMGWRGAVGIVTPLLLIAVGLVQAFINGSFYRLVTQSSGIWFVVMGVTLLALTAWGNMQAQLRATQEILRHLERTRS